MNAKNSLKRSSRMSFFMDKVRASFNYYKLNKNVAPLSKIIHFLIGYLKKVLKDYKTLKIRFTNFKSFNNLHYLV